MYRWEKYNQYAKYTINEESLDFINVGLLDESKDYLAGMPAPYASPSEYVAKLNHEGVLRLRMLNEIFKSKKSDLTQSGDCRNHLDEIKQLGADRAEEGVR